MPANRAFHRTFALAVAIGVIDWALPLTVAEKTLYVGFWLGYVVLAAFGFLAVREGYRYRYVFRRTWPFVGFWFALGILNFILGRGEVPADWSPEMNRLALQGYLLSTALFLPVAFASSGAGVAVAHLLSRLRHDPPPAA
jgi:hypothetical protein